MTNVLVGVDGSEGSRRAAAFGRDVARAFNARLTLLHVIEPHPTETMGGFDDSHKQWYEAQMRRATESARRSGDRAACDRRASAPSRWATRRT